MSNYVPRVTKDKSVRLVPHIPFIVAYLRSKDQRASDMFLGHAKHVDDDEVQSVFNELLDTLATYGDLSTAQLRSLCQDHELPVWARAVHTLFMGSDPRIVPKKVSQGLFNAMNKVKDPNNGAEVAEKLSGELDKLRLISLEALGELCALIRDTSIDARYTAANMGPSIFLDETYVETDLFVASKLMQALVEHAELVFGKSGCRTQFDPLGVRQAGYLEEQRSMDSDSLYSSRSGARRGGGQPPKKEMASALSEAGFM